MKLKKLVLTNFRSFYGRQEVEFAADQGRSLTIIHGENGAGKTNLLNALYWCLTGQFTPRLQNPERLLNRAAYEEDRAAECLVELWFEHETIDFQCVRRVAGRNSVLDLYRLVDGQSQKVATPQNVIEGIIPKGLAQWFFFDAEAIGQLQLSGSDEFRRSLRKILGFELVDGLVEDLDACQRKLQRNLANLVKSKDLADIQERIDGIRHVLPRQKERLETLRAQSSAKDQEQQRIEAELRKLPKAKPLQDRRSRLESSRRNLVQLKTDLEASAAALIGESAPAILALERAKKLDSQLHIKENSGRLPAPFGEQLVEDILRDAMCVCGRSIESHSPEEQRIRGLLEIAATPIFNSRVRAVQFLIKEMAGTAELFKNRRFEITAQIQKTDQEIAATDNELAEIKRDLAKIDDSTVQELETQLATVRAEGRGLVAEYAKLEDKIEENEAEIEKAQANYSRLAKQIGHGGAVSAEIEKLKRVTAYLAKTLKEQESKALSILTVELTQVLSQYLTKHYEPRIVQKTYKVTMVDSRGQEVGESTGEGQILKFAFVSAIVALAARKIGPKTAFLAPSTVAPLVLDAPFSALDPEYQSSVARNLVAQASQVVLLISSAAWSPGVSAALTPALGRRYVLISRESGKRGIKPVKTMMIGDQNVVLNEYDTDRDETIVREFGV